MSELNSWEIIVGLLPMILTYIFVAGAFILTFCFLGDGKPKRRLYNFSGSGLLSSNNDFSYQFISGKK